MGPNTKHSNKHFKIDISFRDRIKVDKIKGMENIVELLEKWLKCYYLCFDCADKDFRNQFHKLQIAKNKKYHISVMPFWK